MAMTTTSNSNEIQGLKKAIWWIFIIFPIVVIVMSFPLKWWWCKKETKMNETGTTKTARQSVADTTVVDVRSVKVTAPVGRWSERITIPCGYSLDLDWDRDYEPGNNFKLYEIRLDGDNSRVQREGKLPDGTFVETHFIKGGVYAEVKSPVGGPVFLEAIFRRRR
jgi:hypothetical protein